MGLTLHKQFEDVDKFLISLNEFAIKIFCFLKKKKRFTTKGEISNLDTSVVSKLSHTQSLSMLMNLLRSTHCHCRTIKNPQTINMVSQLPVYDPKSFSAPSLEVEP
jgi:hypothetical protein